LELVRQHVLGEAHKGVWLTNVRGASEVSVDRNGRPSFELLDSMGRGFGTWFAHGKAPILRELQKIDFKAVLAEHAKTQPPKRGHKYVVKFETRDCNGIYCVLDQERIKR